MLLPCNIVFIVLSFSVWVGLTVLEYMKDGEMEFKKISNLLFPEKIQPNDTEEEFTLGNKIFRR